MPEAYRQRFRYRKKLDSQTFSEFVRDLTSAFNRWCTASEVTTFDSLCNLVVLEQFKNSVPDYVATYVNERKVKCPSEAAVLADEYVLTHKSHFELNTDTHSKNEFGSKQSGPSLGFPQKHNKTSFQKKKFTQGGSKQSVNANIVAIVLLRVTGKKTALCLNRRSPVRLSLL